MHFLERWFGKDWREVYLMLHEDSTLNWYQERDESTPLGGILLKDSPEMIAAGQVFDITYILMILLRETSFNIIQIFSLVYSANS